RIGHIIGPPLRKLSIRKLPVGGGPCGKPGAADAAGDVAAPGEALLNVTGTLDPGIGGPLVGAPGAPGAPGATLVPGTAGAAGAAGPAAAGPPGAAGTGGSCCTGAAGLPGAAGFVIG